MMEAQWLTRRRFGLATLACLAVALLGSASSALAVQSNQYDAFLNQTACPTKSAALNDPEFPEVACVASTSSHLTLKLGNLETEVNSPQTLGFALVPGNPALRTTDCPGAVEECFNAVPGSTAVGINSIKVPLSLPGHHRPPHFPRPPFHHKPHGGYGDPWHGHGGIFHGHRRMLHGFPEPSIEATVEPAGDVRSFTLSLEQDGQTPLFSLPLKVHLEGPLLGRDCYIGSNASPIDVAIFPTAEPEIGFQEDPNGLPVITLLLNGLDVASNTFSVPAAQGCGPVVGFGKYRHHVLDDAINSALGLPSPAGSNLLVLSGSNTALALTFGGGLAMQAAFEAAQQP